MKRYIGTQTIEAEKAIRYETEAGGFYVKLEAEEWKAGDINVVETSISCEAGYAIRYPDGREGFLRKDKFKEIYRPIDGLSFGQAIEAVKGGERIARKGWNGKGQYVELASCVSYVGPDRKPVNAEHAAIGNRALAFCGTSGVQLGWLVSQADMLAEDWEIVE